MGLALGLIPVVVVAVIDDIVSLKPRIKFLGHLCGALIAVASGISLGTEINLFGADVSISVLAFPLSVVWIVGVTNAFNLIDGLDGLSSGLALISASALAAVFLLADQFTMAAAVLVVAGGLLGFLPYNLHPARLFLGDIGATAIGFSLATFALMGGSTLSSGFAVLIPVFILGIPVADTLVAIARRLVGRLERGHGRIFVADQNHIHHRLLALGLDHRTSVLILYGAGVVSAGAAFASLFLNAQEAALFVMALLMAGVIGVHRLGYDEFAFIRRGVVLRVFDFPVVSRSMFPVFMDVAVAVVAAYIAVGLKLDFWSVSAVAPAAVSLASTLAPITIAVFWMCGLYRGSWRLAGASDFMRASTASALVVLIGLIVHPLLGTGNYSPTLLVVYGLVSLVIVTGSRVSSSGMVLTVPSTCSLRTPALSGEAGVLVHAATAP